MERFDKTQLPNDSVALVDSLTPWYDLALSMVQQSLEDAAQGDYEALLWLTSEGRHWLHQLNLSVWVVDDWAQQLT